MFESKELKGLTTEVIGLKREVSALRQEKKDLLKVTELREQIVTLEIEKSKRTEEHEREQRELRHMIGLEKKRQEFEIQQAKRETTVTVREENLKADRTRFEEQMAFNTERFEKEVGYLKDLMVEALQRLPTVTVSERVKVA